MARSIPASILSALSAGSIQPFYAIEMNFDTSPLRLWTGYGDRTIDGQTYLGAGTLLTISALEEVGDMAAKSITLELSAVDATIIALALAEPYQRRRCRVLFGLTDVTGSANFVEVFSGQMNVMTIQEDGQSGVISLVVDSKLVELERTKPRRYTHESQQAAYPGDTFFSYVADLQDKDVPWGRTVEKANDAQS